MKQRIPLLIALFSCASHQLFAQVPVGTKEVWFDPNGTTLASAPGATGSFSSPLGGSGTAFDANMLYLTADAGGTQAFTPGSVKFPNLVIHLKPGIYQTYGHRWPGYGGTEPSWLLRAGQRLIGEGIDRTIIRRINPQNDGLVVIATMTAEANVEVQDLTIDGNYWASSNPNISVGGLNMDHLGRVRGVKFTGTSGNTSTTNETFTLRVSGTKYVAGVRSDDNTARGGLIENCEVSNVKGGYMSGILVGAGQSTVVNNRVYMPHFSNPAVGDNKNGWCGINVGAAVDTIISGNFVSGGYVGLYSDWEPVTNLIVSGNQFLDTIVGINMKRGYAVKVDTIHITDNIFHLSTDTAVSSNRYGIRMTTETADSAIHVSNVVIKDNIVRGGWDYASTWGIYLDRVKNPACYDNRFSYVGLPNPRAMITHFQTVGGMIYNIFTEDGRPMNASSWLTPQSSDWLIRKSILSLDPTTSYLVQVGDKYIGLQKAGYTISLPDAATYWGKEIIIVNETGSTLTGSILNCSISGQTINGAASVSLATPYTSVRVVSNGSSWIRF
ncbi:MAG TPA: hypothetical protein VF773_15420 [Verrucomicrobiae bacterium]